MHCFSNVFHSRLVVFLATLRMTSSNKRIKLREGCHVQKMARPGTVYQLTQLDEESAQCTIRSLISHDSSKAREISCFADKLIPSTLIYYHKECLKHEPLIERQVAHLESAQRVLSPMRQLEKYDLLSKCVVLRPKLATDAQLLCAHSKAHLQTIRDTQAKAKAHPLPRQSQAPQSQPNSTPSPCSEDDASSIALTSIPNSFCPDSAICRARVGNPPMHRLSTDGDDLPSLQCSLCT